MSMTISIDNLRTALRDTNAKAAVAFAEAEKLKDGMIAAGVDPTEGEHFEKVDQAYKAYSVLADESAQIEAKINRLLEIEGLSGKAPAGEPKRPLAGDPERKDGSPIAFATRGRAADRLLASEGYKQLKGSGILEMSDARVATAPVKVLERTEFKTLITGLADTQAGAFILADRQTELLELIRRPRVVAGLVNVGDTDSDMIEYVEQTSRTNNAAEVAEATSSADGAASSPARFAASHLQTAVRMTDDLVRTHPPGCRPHQAAAALRPLPCLPQGAGRRTKSPGMSARWPGAAPRSIRTSAAPKDKSRRPAPPLLRSGASTGRCGSCLQGQA